MKSVFQFHFCFARYRLKAEWVQLFLGLIFAVILFSWSGVLNIRSEVYHSLKTYAYIHQRDVTNHADLLIGYETSLREARGFIYSRLVMSINDPIPMLVSNGLAVLFITSLFQKKRLGPPLAAGFSRSQLFISLSTVFFVCVTLVWVISATYLLKRYYVEFLPEERDFFLTTQFTWFCAFLWKASFAYLAAILLRKPLPAFLVAVAVWVILGYSFVHAPNILPAYIIDNGMTVKSWDPGVDLWPLIRTDIVAAVFFVISIIVGWFSFRKRGME